MSSLIIAAAGAGKTTFLVKKALEISENVLITTYTDANEQSIRDKFYEINGCIPSNVTIRACSGLNPNFSICFFSHS